MRTAGWEVRPLADVLLLQRGYDLPTAEREPGPIPIIGSFGVTGTHSVAKHTGPGVAIGRSGASIGQATYVEGPFWPLNTCLYVKDFKGNDPRWVYRCLESLDFASYNSGSAQPSLNRNFLAQVPVLVPPSDEQRAIAEVLGAFDDKIAANGQIAALANDYLAAYFARLRAEGSAQMLPAGQCVDVATEQVRPMQGSLRYLDIANVSVGGYTYPDRIAWEVAPGRARRKLRFGDTVWSTVRPNRRSHALILDRDEELIGSTGLAVLRAEDGQWAYLYEALRRDHVTDWLVASASGSAYPAVAPSKFAEVPIEWMDEDRRKRFVDVAAPLRLSAHGGVVENRKLAALRDALLPELMSGRITVKDAEASVEGVL